MRIDPRVPSYLGRVLDNDGRPAGTCFQVLPGVLVTACHVLDTLGAGGKGATVAVDPLQGGAVRYVRVERADPDHDLAVLVTGEPLPDCVAGLAASDKVLITAPVIITGVPVLDDPGHSYQFLDAEGHWAGGTTRDEVRLGRVTVNAAMRGMSGAPVLTAQPTPAGQVAIGVVSARYNSADGWARDSVWVARTEDLALLLAGLGDITMSEPPGLSALQRPHPPAPPVGAVARTDLAAATLRSLRDGPAPLVALTGGPGFGKSVLARLVAAVVDTPAASEAGNGGETWCPGGVVWLDVGQDPDLPRLLARQLADLTGQPAGAQSAGQLASDLGEELADRRSLLVLDDVWPPRTGKADLVGLVLSRIKNVPRLVTTRSASFLDAELGARRIDVEEMDQDEAAALLATALPGQATENEAAQLGDFGRLLGRWPLLLGLAAAHLRRQVYGGVPLGDALRDLAARFAAKGVTAFDQRHADLLDASDPWQRDRAVGAAIEASLGQLTPDDQACYRELAVFPPGQPIPVSVIADLWAPGLDRYDTDDLLSMLTDLSLLSLDWSTRQVRVHDLLREYLLPADPQRLTALHRQLLHSWGDPLSLQDSYRIRWYAYHLDSADDSERLYALITPTWRDRVLAVTGALSDAAADILRTAEHAARHGHFPEELRCRLIGTAVAAYVRGLPPALLAAFARLGRLDRALGYAEVLPPEERRIALSVLATALADIDPDRGLDIADRIDNPVEKARTLSSIAVALTPTNPGLALAAADRIDDPAEKARTLSRIAAALTPTNPGLALTAADRIDNSGEKDQALYAFVDCLAGSDPDMALAAVRRINDGGGRAQRLAGIAAVLADTDPDRAQRLTEQALDIADHLDDAESRTATLGGITDYLVRTDPDRALATTDRMDDSWWKEIALTTIVARLAGTDPNKALAAANRIEEDFRKAEALAVIAAAVVAHDPGRASTLADQVLTTANRERNLGRKARALTRSSVALTGVAPDRASTLADQALSTADRIVDSRDKANALADIAAALASTDPDRALAVADRIVDSSSKAKALADIAAALASTDPDRALAVADRIVDSSSKAKALANMAPALASTSPDRVLAVADHIDDGFYKAQALADIAAALASTDVDLAQTLAVADRIDGGFFKAKALTGIAAALADTDPDLALAAAYRIEDRFSQAQALADIAATLADSDPSRASTLADQALAVADRVGIPDGKAPALTGIAAAVADADPELALAVADCIDDRFHKAQALARIAAALANTHPNLASELADQAQTTADQIDEVYYRVRAYMSIARVFADAYPSRALDAADRIGPDWAKARALADIAAALADSDPSRANTLADQALAITNQIDDPAYMIEPLASIAAALAGTDPARASSLANQALSAADNPEEPTVAAQALGDVAVSLTGIDPRLAEATAKRIDDPIDAARTLARIAAKLVRTDPGRASRLADQAVTVAVGINDPAAEAHALAGISAVLTTNMAEVESILIRRLDAVIGPEGHTNRFRDLKTRLRALDPASDKDAWWMLAEFIVIYENASGRHDLLHAVLSAAKW